MTDREKAIILARLLFRLSESNRKWSPDRADAYWMAAHFVIEDFGLEAEFPKEGEKS